MATSGQMQAANLPAVGADFSVSRARRAQHGDIMREAAQLADAGKLKPPVDPRRFSLATTGDAYRAVDDRTAAGKIVVEPAA